MGDVHDVITCAEFQTEIFVGYDFYRVSNFRFSYRSGPYNSAALVRCLRYRLKHIEVIKPWRQIGGRKSVCSTGSVSALQTCAVHSRAHLQCKHKKTLTAGVLSGVMNDGWTESCTNINSDVTYWRQSCRDVFTGSHRRHGSPPSRLSEQSVNRRLAIWHEHDVCRL